MLNGLQLAHGVQLDILAACNRQARLRFICIGKFILEVTHIGNVLGEGKFFDAGYEAISAAADALALEALYLAVQLADRAIDGITNLVLDLFLGAKNRAAFVVQGDLCADQVAAAPGMLMR